MQALPGAWSRVEGEALVWRLRFDGDPAAARAALATLLGDIFIRPADAPMPRLFVADMDSTMITVECIDELADYAGVKAQVAEVTERAMRGELDFAASLRARVALLKDLNEAVLARCHDERVRIMPGAKTLVRTLEGQGVETVLVTGGFTWFADRVAAEIGFSGFHANQLHSAGGKLDGTVAEPILDAEAKRSWLLHHAKGMPEAAIAVGDGANDIPMIKAAGFGIAYHAKLALVQAADAAVRHGDLTAILHGLGIPRSAWVN